MFPSRTFIARGRALLIAVFDEEYLTTLLDRPTLKSIVLIIICFATYVCGVITKVAITISAFFFIWKTVGSGENGEFDIRLG